MWPSSLNIDVSRESLEKLEIYHALLLKWQRAINLVSPSTLSEAWLRHFADSAQLAPYVSRESIQVADLGSGAGFAGLVLAIIRPDLDVHLIESDQRKCEFLKTVSRETNTPITVHNCRIESFEGDFVPNLVTARALAKLELLLDYMTPWVCENPDIEALFLKGENAQTEIAEALHRYEFDYHLTPSLTNNAACVISLQNIKSRA